MHDIMITSENTFLKTKIKKGTINEVIQGTEVLQIISYRCSYLTERKYTNNIVSSRNIHYTDIKSINNVRTDNTR